MDRLSNPALRRRRSRAELSFAPTLLEGDATAATLCRYLPNFLREYLPRIARSDVAPTWNEE